MKKSLKSLMAASCLLMSATTAFADGYKDDDVDEAPKRVILYAFTDIEEGTDYYVLGGAIAAIRGDVYAPGMKVKLQIGGGDYKYSDFDDNLFRDRSLFGSVLLGYAGIKNDLWFGLYAGVDISDHDLKPNDPVSLVKGDKVGFMVSGEVATTSKSRMLYVSAYGSYSTAYNDYYTHLMVGKNLGPVAVGPEVMFLGDDNGNTIRYGGFLKVDLDAEGDRSIRFSGGHGTTNSIIDDGDSLYGQVEVSVAF